MAVHTVTLYEKARQDLKSLIKETFAEDTERKLDFKSEGG